MSVLAAIIEHPSEFMVSPGEEALSRVPNYFYFSGYLSGILLGDKPVQQWPFNKVSRSKKLTGICRGLQLVSGSDCMSNRHSFKTPRIFLCCLIASRLDMAVLSATSSVASSTIASCRRSTTLRQVSPFLYSHNYNSRRFKWRLDR